MRGIYFDGLNAEYREDLPMPIPAENQSLIKIEIAAVCSTDKEILKGYMPNFKGVMGHEFAGIVEQSNVPELIGKRVVGEINENCGTCLYCRTGRPHHCLNVRTPGLSKDGCFAEYMALKTDLLHVIPDNLPTDVAVFTEPLAAAFEILEQIEVPKDTPVAIVGDGRLALCIANVMHLVGADLTVIGRHPEKLKVFESLGKTTTEKIRDGYEIVIEACGNPSGLDTALEVVRKKGTIVLKSTYAQPATLGLSIVPVNELTIVGSRCGPFEPALKALSENKIILPAIEKYDLKDFAAAFASKAFKSGFEF